ERVCREGGHEDRDHGRRDADEEAVQEVRADGPLTKHVRVVLEAEVVRREERRPPAGAERLGGGPEGVDEEAKGRDRPDDHQHDECGMEADVVAREPSLFGTGLLHRRGGHRTASWARKRPMLKNMIGMIASSRTTA